ncbi:MAG: hypothetical protein IT322_16985 [Anaerolineae bacterium]|nr:hypothetical protein [Anaerolineae bacterium]
MTFVQSSEYVRPNEVQELKQRLLALSSERLAQLRLSYYYRTMLYEVSTLGWLNLFLGAAMVWLGTSNPSNAPLSTFQAIYGVAVVGVSLWSIIWPQPSGVAVWVVVLGVAGIWNVYLYFSFNFPPVGILGLVQLWWAYNLNRLFRLYGRKDQPDAESLQHYDTFQRAAQKFEPSDDPDPEIIRFKRGNRWWQGFLLPDRVVFASRKGLVFLIAERSAVTFTFNHTSADFGSRILCTIKIGDITIKKLMFSRTAWQHYKRWKEQFEVLDQATE